jgi:hypothetical protein
MSNSEESKKVPHFFVSKIAFKVRYNSGVIHEWLLLHSFWIVPHDTCLHFFYSDNRMMKLSVVTAILLLRFVAVFAYLWLWQRSRSHQYP